MPSRFLLFLTACVATLALEAAPANAADAPRPKPNRVRPLTRLVFQDPSDNSIRWFDVEIDDQKRLTATAAATVAGMKKLDAERQTLGQLRESQNMAIAAVRDDDDGAHESGWVLVDSGVRYRDHGDHGHWSFKNPPALAASVLDKNQGNPAHVYVYDGRFFVANDHKNGYTRLDPAAFLEPEKRAEALKTVRFVEGGGNHITLATADDKVGYSAWIDRDGEKKGQVDVTLLQGPEPRRPAYSFHLPSGGIHGAAVAAGRVFFAPSDGICWTEIDHAASKNAKDVSIRHLSLGTHEDVPRRTGAFVVEGRHVLFTTGKSQDARLAIVDAAQAEPKPVLLKLNLKEGALATTPSIKVTAKGRALAFVFHDHPVDVEMDDQLSIIDLDPNRDGQFSDAAIVQTLPVGPSEVEGHSGHHAIAFDAEGNYAFFTNPGSGKVTALRLADLKPAGEFAVGGKPGAVVAFGGREVKD